VTATLVLGLFEEKGDKIKESLVLAWLYKELTNKYYSSKKYFP